MDAEDLFLLAGLGLLFLAWRNSAVATQLVGVASDGGVVTIDLEPKIQLLMRAIAQAEGFGQPGAVPTRANNPGDLGPGDCGSQYPVIHATGSDVCQLPSADVGWQLLHDKIARILAGMSSTFSTSMTIAEMGQKYAATGGPGMNWATNVAHYLGVPVTTRLDDWIQGNV